MLLTMAYAALCPSCTATMSSHVSVGASLESVYGGICNLGLGLVLDVLVARGRL
jgi:hypothetical protein